MPTALQNSFGAANQRTLRLLIKLPVVQHMLRVRNLGPRALHVLLSGPLSAEEEGVLLATLEQSTKFVRAHMTLLFVATSFSHGLRAEGLPMSDAGLAIEAHEAATHAGLTRIAMAGVELPEAELTQKLVEFSYGALDRAFEGVR